MGSSQNIGSVCLEAAIPLQHKTTNFFCSLSIHHQIGDFGKNPHFRRAETRYFSIPCEGSPLFLKSHSETVAGLCSSPLPLSKVRWSDFEIFRIHYSAAQTEFIKFVILILNKKRREVKVYWEYSRNLVKYMKSIKSCKTIMALGLENLSGCSESVTTASVFEVARLLMEIRMCRMWNHEEEEIVMVIWGEGGRGGEEERGGILKWKEVLVLLLPLSSSRALK